MFQSVGEIVKNASNETFQTLLDAKWKNESALYSLTIFFPILLLTNKEHDADRLNELALEESTRLMINIEIGSQVTGAVDEWKDDECIKQDLIWNVDWMNEWRMCGMMSEWK